VKSDTELMEEAERAFNNSQFDQAKQILAPLLERNVPDAILLDCSHFEAGLSDESMDRIYEAGVIRAADLGSMAARYIMGVWYEYGEQGFEEDKSKASRIFKELAEEGDLHCLWIYACDLLWGRGAFKVDVELGLRMIRRAIDQGSSESCSTLAKIYNDGDFGLGPDIEERDRLRNLARELADEDEYVWDPWD